jgi:hypothetical protein
VTDDLSFQQELQIEVKAGQTLVLEIVTKDAESGGTTGSFEIRIRDEAGNPVTGTFKLVSEDGGIEIPVNVVDGAGRVDPLPAGNYIFKDNSLIA